MKTNRMNRREKERKQTANARYTDIWKKVQEQGHMDLEFLFSEARMEPRPHIY